MRGDTNGPNLLQPGVAVIESEDEDSATSLDFNTSDFLPFWDYTEDDEGECPTSLDSEFGTGAGIFEARAVPGLVTLAAEAYLAIPNVWALERFIKKATPKALFPKLLATCLLADNPRKFTLKLLLKHWPRSVLTLTELMEACPRFRHYLKRFSHNQEEISALLMDTLLDTYYSGIGYVATLKLRIFDFALLPKSAAYQRLLRRVLMRHIDVLEDWCAIQHEGACYIRTYICMNGQEEFTFWIDFLRRCPDYLRIVGLDMDSPLFTGNGDSMKKVMKFLEKDLTQLHLKGERLYNKEGVYETDVDHLAEIYKNLYHKDLPPWQLKLKNLKNLVSLSLFCPPAVPHNEAAGQAITLQDREVRRISPCAIRNWSTVFRQIPKLKHLSLRGNFLKYQLEHLLKNVPFTLLTLNLEGCDLDDRDLRFLARSHHKVTLTEMSLGDLDLGEKFGGLLKLISVIPKLASLELCIEGYDRYRDNTAINEYQAAELISAICKHHMHTIKYVNFGGHPWTKPFLLKVAKFMVPLPSLTNLILPIDGLARESIERYVAAKLADVSGLLGPPEDISFYGEEFHELKMAVMEHMERKVDAGKLKTRALRDGMQFLM